MQMKPELLPQQRKAKCKRSGDCREPYQHELHLANWLVLGLCRPELVKHGSCGMRQILSNFVDLP